MDLLTFVFEIRVHLSLDKSVGKVLEGSSSVTDDAVSLVLQITVVVYGVLRNQIDVIEEILRR